VTRDQLAEIVLKGVVAATFFFVLQYVIMKASLDTSLFWAIALGLGASMLAWSQHTRT
jgi:hypothetical protein